MRYDPKDMRMVVSLRPDGKYAFDKPYSWALQSFIESEGGWHNVHFDRADSPDEAFEAAKDYADKMELEMNGKITPLRERLKLIPSVKDV
jgi:hypothetical protein